MRRVLLPLVLIAIGVACSNDPNAGKIQLRYMAWGNPQQLDVEQKLVDDFNRRNPDLYVKLFKVPGSAYQNKMVVMMASRTAPDIIRIDHYAFPNYVRKEYFHEMDSLAAQDPDFDRDDFFPQALEEGTYNGKLYGLNSMPGGIMMYYNKTMFRQAGLADPYELWKRDEWTWERLRDSAVALTQRGPDGRPKTFGVELLGGTNTAIILWAFGGDLLDASLTRCLLDRPGSIAAIQFLHDLRWKLNVAPTPSQAALSAFAFESGKLGMVFDWMGRAPRLRDTVKSFEWDVCPVPKGPAGGPTTMKGNQIVIYAESEHPQEAWRFVRFMTSRETEMFYYGVLRRGAPSRRSVAYSDEFLKADRPPFNTRVYLHAFEDGRPLPINHRWSEWTTVLNNHLGSIFLDPRADVGARLREAKREIDAVLSSEEGF